MTSRLRECLFRASEVLLLVMLGIFYVVDSLWDLIAQKENSVKQKPPV